MTTTITISNPDSLIEILESTTVVEAIETVVVVTEATTGPQGIPGPGVPLGGSVGQVLTKTGVDDYQTSWETPTATLAYTHHQASASSSWSITHELGWNPNVTVVDTAGNTVVGDIVYDSPNQLTLQFAAAFAGIAHLS